MAFNKTRNLIALCLLSAVIFSSCNDDYEYGGARIVNRMDLADVDLGVVPSGETAISSSILTARIDGDVTVTVEGVGFSVSLSQTADFGSSIIVPQEVVNDTSLTIYFQFEAGEEKGDFSGTATISSVGLDDVSVPIVANVGSALHWIEDFDYDEDQVPALDRIDENARETLLTDSENWYNLSGRIRTLVDPGLTFDGYIGSGIGKGIPTGNREEGTQNYSRTLGRIPTDGQKIYVSFLWRMDDGATANSNGRPIVCIGTWKDDTGTDWRYRFVLRNTDDGLRFAIVNNGNEGRAVTVDKELTVGQTYLIVIKKEHIAGDLNDEGSVFIFEEGDDFSSEPLTPDQMDVTGSVDGDTEYPSECVVIPNNNDQHAGLLDGIRVSNTWNDLFAEQDEE